MELLSRLTRRSQPHSYEEIKAMLENIYTPTSGHTISSPHPLYRNIFSKDNEKTERTFWVYIYIDEDRRYTVECKPLLNRASKAADTIRNIIGKRPIWIPCTIIARTSHEGPEVTPLDVFIKGGGDFIPTPRASYNLAPIIQLDGSAIKRFPKPPRGDN